MTAEPAELARFRTAYRAAQQSVFPELFRRMTMDRDSLARLQTERLRELLGCALRAPFWARRLSGIDVARLTPAELSRIPVTTKGELMAELDDSFTDRRLSRTLVERTLAATTRDVVPLFGEYLAQATGGSSGERGVFVSDAKTWAEISGSAIREVLAAAAGVRTIAFVAASSPIHSTGLASALNDPETSPLQLFSVPVTLPLGEIVERLNAIRPDSLNGYPTALVPLARERQAGRLRVDPRLVVTTSETLTPELRAAIRAGFGAPIVNMFGTTEGLMGATAPDDAVFAFNSDACIAELVDADERPVPIGTPCDHVLITNLANRVQPIIRYRLDDSFTREPDSATHGRLRASVTGRTGETLCWGGVEIHRLAISSVLLRHPNVIDYQVRQTARGVDVSVVATGPVAEARLAEELRCALVAAGLRAAQVTLERVDSLARHAETGKVRRFVPARNPSC